MADIKLKQLEDQLKRIGCNFRFWGRAELRELANVLLPGEVLEHCVNGSYEGGFALLAATDQRVLLVDKKPMYLTLEDIRFDMISEIDFNHRMLNSNVFICTPNKTLRFVGYNQARLRRLFHFVQTRVAEIRQHYTMLQQGQQQEAYVAYSQQLQQPALQFSAPAPLPPPARDMELFDAAAMAQLPQQQAQRLPGPRHHQPTMTQATAYRLTAPVISAYTRMPLMSRQRRFLGSRAMNSPQPSIYQQ
jgi:hypothetical protein